jgi:ubiquinone biosynthesis protein Coq4
VTYPDTDRLADARARYFTDNGFPSDGGYSARWVRIALGPVPVYIYNSASRVRAVRLHDLHHVLTEYDTTLIGEAEIGAWELASGCKDYVAAWGLNLGAVLIGLCLSPRRVMAAFARGRRSDNLYGRSYDDALLQRSVGSLRRELSLESWPRRN